jgi:PGF-pre-PGF domain-containing protein
MTIKEYTMIGTKRSTGKIFSIVFTVALICLMAVAIIPSVNAASAVDLGSAGNYAILTKTGITTTGTTKITGNIGVSPIAATAMTGFGLSMDASNQFSRSSLVTGNVYAANYAPPTPATMTTAVSAMEAAYTSAAGQAPDATELYAGNLGGRILAPGVYKWSTGVLIPSATDLTLDAKGNSGAVWVFQVAGDLTMDPASRVVLANGAQAQNVYWQIGGGTGAIIGSGAHAEGNILAAKAITMNSGASLNGRALAQTAVTLIANTITATPSATSTPAQAQTAVPTSVQTVVPTLTQTVAPTPVPKYEPIPTSAPTDLKTTVPVNVGGISDVTKVDVTGTGNKDMIVTGISAYDPGKNVVTPPGTVYRYFDLVPARYNTVDGVVISFSVRKQWLDDNKISPQSIVLYHLDGGTTWTALPTKLVKNGDAKADYNATSPGFSRFAITAQNYPVTATTVQTAAPIVSTVAQTPIATQTTAQPTPLPTTKSPVPVWVPVSAVICTLLIMAVFSGRKGKNS